jgi:hypothetical protein
MGSAASLTGKIDALADALRAAGVEPERVAKILGSAAEATMHALVLDAVLDEQAVEAATAPAAERATAEDTHIVPDAETVRLAA